MGIYIRGMEMPRRCEECCICHYEEQGTIVWCGCRATMRIRPVGCDSKPDFCPLIEIPPHGRLGDLDELEQMFADIDHAPYSGFDGEDLFYSAADAAQIISLSPTIIPADYPPSIPLKQVWTEVFGEDGE